MVLLKDFKNRLPSISTLNSAFSSSSTPNKENRERGITHLPLLLETRVLWLKRERPLTKSFKNSLLQFVQRPRELYPELLTMSSRSFLRSSQNSLLEFHTLKFITITSSIFLKNKFSSMLNLMLQLPSKEFNQKLEMSKKTSLKVFTLTGLKRRKLLTKSKLINVC